MRRRPSSSYEEAAPTPWPQVEKSREQEWGTPDCNFQECGKRIFGA